MVGKISAGVVGGLLLVSLAAASAFADVSAEISGNGAGSDNSILININSNCRVSQNNSTAVLTDVDSLANTGGNNANGNTGGDVSIDTGNAASDVSVTVKGGSNNADNPCCCDSCGSSEVDQIISGNGDESINFITLRKSKRSEVRQRNRTGCFRFCSFKSQDRQK